MRVTVRPANVSSATVSGVVLEACTAFLKHDSICAGSAPFTRQAVSADGTFLMPYLKRMKAEGKTTDELSKEIADGLRVRQSRSMIADVRAKGEPVKDESASKAAS